MMCLDFMDVVRAYLHAKARRDVHVDLPEEDYQEEDEYDYGEEGHDKVAKKRST